MTPKKTRRKVAVQKSIFTRYLAITMGIVVLSFIMLGTVMMAFFSQYWKNEKRDLLTQNAASIAEMSNAFLSKTSEDTYQLQTTVLKTFIDAFSTSIDADIFITDLEGNILLGNYPNSKLSQPQSVPQQTVSLAAQGMYEGRNTFGGLYRSPSFIIGVPMYAGQHGKRLPGGGAANVPGGRRGGAGHHLYCGGGLCLPPGAAPAADERRGPHFWRRGFLRAGAGHQRRRAGPAGPLL